MNSTRDGSEGSAHRPHYPGRGSRVLWTVVSGLVAETVVFALAALPAALLWTAALPLVRGPLYARLALFAFTLVPAYMLFTFGLMVYSAWATRLLGWRTEPDKELALVEVGRPLMNLLRGATLHHFVRIFAGTLYRGSPAWTFYLRLNGAKVGARVYVNTLAIGDCSLLEIGEGSVIGSDVHIGGHWVERGVMRTGRVRLGQNVMIGNGSVVGIGVTIEDGVQVGALSVVPKGVRLEAHGVYVGAPATRIRESKVTGGETGVTPPP